MKSVVEVVPRRQRAKPDTIVAMGGTLSRAAALLLVFCALAAPAQTLSEEQIKAGFLFNFTRFVEWPAKAFPPRSNEVVLCIVDEHPIYSMLGDAFTGKAVNGRTITYREAKWNDDLHLCNVLFVSQKNSRRSEHLLQALRGNPTLTVGEDAGFIQAGGMINFAIQDNKIRMDLNLEAATVENLKISAKLIAVSRLVTGNSSAKGN